MSLACPSSFNLTAACIFPDNTPAWPSTRFPNPFPCLHGPPGVRLRDGCRDGDVRLPCRDRSCDRRRCLRKSSLCRYVVSIRSMGSSSWALCVALWMNSHQMNFECLPSKIKRPVRLAVPRLQQQTSNDTPHACCFT